ncbi:MAG: hypothetical protein FJ303_15065 [Planctomycetes bacterium]|nr:hypothetical protein [Planctomycetota bacterium]
MDAWIDTGITGELVLPMQMIAPMGLPLGPAVPATLADGSVVQRDAYSSSVDRFGKWTNIEVVANQGTFPLLGVGLLLGHHLDIDYSGRTLSLT